jgi:hypothetical protein
LIEAGALDWVVGAEETDGEVLDEQPTRVILNAIKRHRKIPKILFTGHLLLIYLLTLALVN